MEPQNVTHETQKMFIIREKSFKQAIHNFQPENSLFIITFLLPSQSP